MDSTIEAVDGNGVSDAPSPECNLGGPSSALCLVILVIAIGNGDLSVVVASVDGGHASPCS